MSIKLNNYTSLVAHYTSLVAGLEQLNLPVTSVEGCCEHSTAITTVDLMLSTFGRNVTVALLCLLVSFGISYRRVGAVLVTISLYLFSCAPTLSWIASSVNIL